MPFALKFLLTLIGLYAVVALVSWIVMFALYRVGLVDSDWGQLFPTKWRK